jgi:hypothetical protein
VRPFVDTDAGVVRVDAERTATNQTSYGAAAMMDWGVEWRAHENFGLSFMARLEDRSASTITSSRAPASSDDRIAVYSA